MRGQASCSAEPGETARRAEVFGILALGVVQASQEQVRDMRTRLGPPGGPPFPASFLKPSDEQTVVALAAVLQAIERYGWQGHNFSRWGAVAAPRFLGRVNGAETIHKFETGGAWKVSPLFVAHRSMHAVSGTISQALKINGPNFGVGGGRNAVAEAMLTALSLLDDCDLPGLWMALTQCDPEPRPDRQGAHTVPVSYQAVALALQPVAADWQGLRLFLKVAAGTGPDCGQMTGAGEPPFEQLLQFIDKGLPRGRFGTWTCPMNWGHELRLSDEP
jgi:hypothetical protein